MKLVIENHFPNEGYVQDDAVSHAEHDAGQISVLAPNPYEKAGQGNEHQGNDEDIGI